VLFGVFAAVGAGMFYFFSYLPLHGVMTAGNWVQRPCSIVSSEVKVASTSKKSTTYTIEIVYDYTFNDIEYQGRRYDFSGGYASSGRSGKQAVVDKYPAGSESVCYVNPAVPSQAVLNRGLTSAMWIGLFPIPFLAVGVIGLLATAGILGRKKADVPWQNGIDPSGPVVLKPQTSPLAKFLAMVFFALFWNGIVSVFVYMAVRSFVRGRPEWFLSIFIIPFVLVGLAVFVSAFYSLFAIFIPRPTLTLSRAQIPLGGRARLSWTFSGNPYALRRLRIYLRAEEKCTYRQGKNTRTEEHRFHNQTIFETQNQQEFPNGEIEIRVPADTMHSFVAANNKVIWTIHMEGEIPLRPDINADFPFTVTPHGQPAS
jgi:hypothetical protein